MAAELNELSSITTKMERDWIIIMNEWIRCVDEDYKSFTGSMYVSVSHHYSNSRNLIDEINVSIGIARSLSLRKMRSS